MDFMILSVNEYSMVWDEYDQKNRIKESSKMTPLSIGGDCKDVGDMVFCRSKGACVLKSDIRPPDGLL